MRSAARLLLLIPLAAGCAQIEAWRDQRRRPIVYVDIVDRALAAEGLPQARPRTEAALQQVMRRWPDFAYRLAKPGEPGWQLDLRVAQASQRGADAQPGAMHRAAGVRLELRALEAVEQDPASLSVEALVTMDAPADAPFADVLDAAILEAGQRMQASMALHWGPEDDLLAALDAEPEWRRLLAIHAAGRRRLKAAVPALMALVRDERQSSTVVVSAVGALVGIGATEAASVIIDACHRREPEYVVQMIFALGALGGREAEAYLFTVQSGHPVPEVKAAAAEALEELTRRQAPPGD